MNASKEKRACYSALKDNDPKAYAGHELRQPKIRKLIRQRLAQLQNCTTLDCFERHVIAVMLHRKRLRILDKDLINRLYYERVKEAP